MGDLQDYIKKTTREQFQEPTTGLWLKKWFQLYGAVLTQGLRLYLSRFLLLFLACLCVISGSVISFGVLCGPLFVGMYALVFEIIDRQAVPSPMPMLRRGFHDALTTILCGVICVTVLGGGYLLLSSLPFIGVMLAYCYLVLVHSFIFLLFPLLADRPLRLIPALCEGLALARSHWLPYAVFSFAAFVLGMGAVAIVTVIISPFLPDLSASPILSFFSTALSMIFLIVALAANTPLYFCLIALFYSDMKKDEPPQITENIPLRRR